MSAGDPHDGEHGAGRKLSLWQRLLLRIQKPTGSGVVSVVDTTSDSMSVEELQAAVKSADDKERLVGLIVAPIAAAISILVISALVSNDPAALLSNGQPNRSHVNVSRYEELLVVLLAISVLMLVTAMLRKRLYLGILSALFGLAVFNLHYWGFGVPFVMVGAWLLVRSYRLQRNLKDANGGVSPPRRAAKDSGAITARVRPSNRYTPPVRRTKSGSTKPRNQKRAG